MGLSFICVRKLPFAAVRIEDVDKEEPGRVSVDETDGLVQDYMSNTLGISRNI